jgi:hypothetical protein
MRKIKLDVITLAVESFATQAWEAPPGTVKALSSQDGISACLTCWTQLQTCPNTCQQTCDDATCQSCPVGACGGDLSAAHGTCYNCNTGEPQESDAGCATLTT